MSAIGNGGSHWWNLDYDKWGKRGLRVIHAFSGASDSSSSATGGTGGAATGGDGGAASAIGVVVNPPGGNGFGKVVQAAQQIIGLGVLCTTAEAAVRGAKSWYDPHYLSSIEIPDCGGLVNMSEKNMVWQRGRVKAAIERLRSEERKKHYDEHFFRCFAERDFSIESCRAANKKPESKQ